MDLLERFRTFYTALNRCDLSALKTVYSDDVTFIDPVGKHDGLGQLKHYLQALLDGCRACTFTIKDLRANGETAFAQWTMAFTHDKLNAGGEIHVDGLSVLSIENDRIHEQRDYYDMGAMVYEHVPLLGSAVRALRRRLAP